MRQSWFYQLVRRNLINDGSVSFLLHYYPLSELPNGISIDNKAEIYQWIFEQGCDIFAKEHEQMRLSVPFQNFTGELEQVVCDSHVGLVIETYFDRPGIIAFSEKVFRALQLPRPFLLYCSPGAISVLRDQGFDMYDDILDHSYDHETNNITRQVAILNEIENSKNFVYNEEILENFEQRASHNRMLLKGFKDQWPKKLEKIINTYK
jgi:hypothetical protein